MVTPKTNNQRRQGFLVLVLCFMITASGGCQGPPAPKPVVTPVKRIDRTPPVLLKIHPAQGYHFAGRAQTKVAVHGIVSDNESIATVLINQKPVELVHLEKNKYHFTTDITAHQGPNTYSIVVLDGTGNRYEQRITFVNGDLPVLLLEPEHQKLAPQGLTYFRAWLVKDHHKKILPPREVKFEAQQGEFRANAYKAPDHACTDLVKATHLQTGAHGQYHLKVLDPKLAVDFEVPSGMLLGSGQQLSIQLHNQGPIAVEKIWLQLELPKILQYVRAQPDGKYRADVRLLEWYLAKIAAHESQDLSVWVKGLRMDEALLKLHLRATGLDAVVQSRRVRVHDVLQISQRIIPRHFRAGDQVTLLITIRNLTPHPLHHVQLRDYLPPQWSCLATRPPAVGRAAAVCFPPLVRLAARAQQQYRLTIRVNHGRSFTNQVAVSVAERSKPIKHTLNVSSP